MSLSSRRQFVAGALGLVAMRDLPAAAENHELSLAECAAKKGLLYGCAVSSDRLANDKPFAALVADQAAILAPEWELKRDPVQSVEGQWNFSGADGLAEFARQHRQKMRGHTLVWYYGVPPWIEQRLRDARSENLLTDMITVSCERFKGRMHSWDVLNEIVEPQQGHPDGIRIKSPWYQAFGDSYFATAFEAARAADPDCLLFYGDYNVEMASREHELRRTAVLKLIEKLKKQNAPIDAFGVQGHLRAFRDRFDEEVYARFLRDVQGFGLKLMVTEFDVADRGGPADIAKRDAEVASLTRRFMDVSLDNAAMLGVITWGLSDKYSWLSVYPDYKWPAGQLSRGLPYDGGLQPKPMRAAIADAFLARK